MNRSEIHQAISDALTQLEITNNRLYLHSEALPKLEVDLLRKQAIDCYDLINKLALVAGQTIEETPKPSDFQTVDSQSVMSDYVAKRQPEESPKVKEVRTTTPKGETEPKAEESKEEEKKPASEVRAELKEAIESETKEENQVENDSVVNKLRNEATSVVDRFTSQGIDDIKKAVSISKRFEFQSALFDNDRVMYEKTMEYFNTAEDQTEGLARFKEMMDAHGWDNESKLVQELEQMVERRYT